MSELFTKFKLRLKVLLRRHQLERDLEDEIAFHVATREEKLRENGAVRSEIHGFPAIRKSVTRMSQNISSNDTSGPQVILYDASLHENFIFFLRAYDPSRRFVVKRKALYSTGVVADLRQEGIASLSIRAAGIDQEIWNQIHYRFRRVGVDVSNTAGAP